ncbi:hypothetical protein Sjap_012988 [Stephania japonica]|uniref:Uncharacterized protein n=1 Tax=Stephania japonica TaxID=461633 RepID=A0AAP0P0W9_9MAGN
MVFKVLVTVHIGEMTVRETLAFSARVQGVGAGHAKLLLELSRREKEANIKPDPDLDLFMMVKRRFIFIEHLNFT